MPEIARFTGCTDWIGLDFVERQRMPERAMKFGILEELGVERSRKAIDDWVQKADLQPAESRTPNHIAVDETVIRTNNQALLKSSIGNMFSASCWMYSAYLAREYPNFAEAGIVRFRACMERRNSRYTRAFC